eukprot:1867821-Ditylum_brightwellii.AAC.1
MNVIIKEIENATEDIERGVEENNTNIQSNDECNDKECISNANEEEDNNETLEENSISIENINEMETDKEASNTIDGSNMHTLIHKSSLRK